MKKVQVTKKTSVAKTPAKKMDPRVEKGLSISKAKDNQLKRATILTKTKESNLAYSAASRNYNKVTNKFAKGEKTSAEYRKEMISRGNDMMAKGRAADAEKAKIQSEIKTQSKKK